MSRRSGSNLSENLLFAPINAIPSPLVTRSIFTRNKRLFHIGYDEKNSSSFHPMFPFDQGIVVENFMSLLRGMRSTANLFHGQLPFGRWALCIANSAVTRCNCRDIGVGWRAASRYRLSITSPRPFRTRRILQAGWMLPAVINYGRTLNSIHEIRIYIPKPLHADPIDLSIAFSYTTCPTRSLADFSST